MHARSDSTGSSLRSTPRTSSRSASAICALLIRMATRTMRGGGRVVITFRTASKVPAPARFSPTTTTSGRSEWTSHRRKFNRGCGSMARLCTPREVPACGPGAVVGSPVGVAGRPVGPAARRRRVAPGRSGTAAHTKRPRPVCRGARGGVEVPQGAWRGAALAVGRRRMLRTTDAPVEGGLRAPG